MEWVRWRPGLWATGTGIPEMPADFQMTGNLCGGHTNACASGCFVSPLSASLSICSYEGATELGMTFSSLKWMTWRWQRVCAALAEDWSWAASSTWVACNCLEVQLRGIMTLFWPLQAPAIQSACAHTVRQKLCLFIYLHITKMYVHITSMYTRLKVKLIL